MKEIYLDNNATTKVDEDVFEEMRPYFCELYGNPSSMHFFGGQVQNKVNEARIRVADLLGATPDEIIFTACGTESDNAAIRSALEVFPERRHIITSRVEHPAVLTQCRNLTQKGYRVTEIGAGRAGMAHWSMECSLSGRFTAFSASFTHAFTVASLASLKYCL